MAQFKRIDIPPKDDLLKHVDAILGRERLTANGPLALELEKKISEYLDVKHVLLTSSATLGLQIAYHALGLNGEILTPSYSWISTASSMTWTGLKPRFVDIGVNSLTACPADIERRMTPSVSAIVPVHIFGHACDVDAIGKIAKKHHIPVIYDAAHAFGSTREDKSLARFGDVVVFSLNATKCFHAVEGGVIVCRDAELYDKMKALINYGSGVNCAEPLAGINGRLSELHAAVGLGTLRTLPSRIQRNQIMAAKFRELLYENTSVQFISPTPKSESNDSYFPVIFETNLEATKAVAALNTSGFECRRYFNPPLHKLSAFSSSANCPVAEDLSARTACLPFDGKTSDQEIQAMTDIIGNICQKKSSSDISSSDPS